MLSIIISNRWIIHSANLEWAFLQGKGINQGAYLKPPKVVGTTKIQKLKITVYELFDTQRVWYMSFNKVSSEDWD